MMKFAFIIMGNFNFLKDYASIHDGMAQIVGVANLQEACTAARQLYLDGAECIELCGAFGAEGAKKIIDVTENKIPIGYITHLPEQDEVYEAAFADIQGAHNYGIRTCWFDKNCKGTENAADYVVKHLDEIKEIL